MNQDFSRETVSEFLSVTIKQQLTEALEGVPPDIVEHVVALVDGGKKFRPFVLLATAESFGLDMKTPAYFAAAMLEILHRASLMHDDFVDGAVERNGIETLHHKFNPTVAVYIPQLLSAHALASMTPFPRLDTSFNGAWKNILHGQLAERVMSNRPHATYMMYRNIVCLKSSGLATCALFAGHWFGTGDRDFARALELGQAMALLFQLVDDLEDIPADAASGIRTAPWFFLTIGEQGITDPALLAEKMQAERILLEIYYRALEEKSGLIAMLRDWLPECHAQEQLIAAIEQRWDERIVVPESVQKEQEETQAEETVL